VKRNGHASDAKGAGDLLRRRIDSNLASPTRTETAIASYFVNETSTLPFETAGSVAAKIGVSEASVGRFCRSIGFRHFKELKASLRDDFGDRAWLIGDRLREFAVRSQTDKANRRWRWKRKSPPSSPITNWPPRPFSARQRAGWR
jgi:DNA-binding MurR/RpiR family transcriptional regulator